MKKRKDLREEAVRKCTNRGASGKTEKEDGIVITCKYVKCFWNEERNNQFSTPREDGKRINGLELRPGRFKIDIKQNFPTTWIMTHQNRLPEELL